jgi:hypothetical protein
MENYGTEGQPRANIFTRGGHNVTDTDEFIKKGEQKMTVRIVILSVLIIHFFPAENID